MRICPTCNGKGWKMEPKKRVKGNKVQTVMEKNPCPQCGWSGWVPA